METTAAKDGALLIRSFDSQREPQEIFQVYDAHGTALSGSWVPFARSVAGTVSSLQEPYTINRLDETARQGNLELQPFEKGRHSLLAAPLSIGPGMQGVLELFDKQVLKSDVRSSEFTESDKRLAAVAAPLGAAMLRQAVSERQTNKVLFDAIDAALKASDSLTASLKGSPGQRLQEPPPDNVLEQIREGLADTGSQPQSTEELLELAESIRVLALRHGPSGLKHCNRIVKSTRDLLDQVTGSGEGPIL
jgi:two-component system nitrogen regulation response regulator NtrX